MPIKYTRRLFIALFLLAFAVFAPIEPVEAADTYQVIVSDAENCGASIEEASWAANAILYAADLYAVDPLLVAAVMHVESHFHAGAISPAGAIGFMQLMPATASSLGVDPYDPLANVLGGTAYLSQQLARFAGWGDYAISDAIAAYNAGPNAVIAYGGVPPYYETVNYVRSVADVYDSLRAGIED